MTAALTRKRRAGSLLLLLAIALAAASLFTVSRARRIWQHIASAQTGLVQLDSALGGGPAGIAHMLGEPSRLRALRASVLALRNDFASIAQLARPALKLSGYLSWIPAVGDDISAAPHLLKLADRTCDAAMSLLDGLSPLAEHLAQEGQDLRGAGPQLLDSTRSAEPQLASARAALAQAQAARSKINAASLHARLSEPIARFDSVAPMVETALDSLELLPNLLGAGEPRAYLVLAQNSDELRATGGFISGVGLVRVSEGQVTSVSFQDSYAVDILEKAHPDAPEPLRQHMGTEILMLRDANWWPDFGTSASVVRELYRQDTGQSVNGVVAVDERALELLVAVLGSVQIPGYAEPVSSGNLRDMLRRFWEAPTLIAPGEEAEWWSHRKDFAGDLLAALIVQAERQGTESLSDLVTALWTALDERHIQVYLPDPTASELLSRVGWSGAVRNTPGDFLMVVDSNVGFNKVNPHVQQAIDLAVQLDHRGLATSHLTLSYRHLVDRPTPACIHEPRYGDSYADLMDRCYWDYLRVYLPPDSKVIEVRGSDTPPEIYQESGRTVVGMSFLLETGQARAIQVRYSHSLPGSSDRYSLLVQKQAGALNHQLRVQVDWGKGAAATACTPAPITTGTGNGTWQSTLTQDLYIDCRRE
ncbi:MAG TPA: DUF4012 domain-containing protein [Anaerolineae bacterium]|nr:DUF4012 domain-containing protein [Anaerolineae bacterium]